VLAGAIGDSAKPAMTAPYLATLNPEQRSAVEHGAAEPRIAQARRRKPAATLAGLKAGQ
jgi:hypothetical protein